MNLKELVNGIGWRRDLLLLTMVVAVGAILYAHTLSVPMYLDDNSQIVNNPDVLSLQTAWNQLFASRGLITLTFAMNYHLGGADVAGYHLVNIAVHLATACLVYLLLKRVFPTRPLLPFGGALFFVAHPLQTQAVTYIVQRATSLAAFFFFLALYLYVRAREAGTEGEGRTLRHWLFYAGALVCGALAVFTKQNTAVLPVALILFDRYFLPGKRQSWRQLLLYVAPFALAPAWSGARSLLFPLFSGGSLANVGAVAKLAHLEHLSPLNYLVTEFPVLWLYIRLLFLPYGQALEYDIPIAASLWNLKSAMAFLGLVLLAAAAIALRKRQPAISAGIWWFFIGLAVESSIIPLDPVFEHRLYIPMFGFALMVMAGLDQLPRRTAPVALVLAIAALSVLTWQRNALWNHPQSFYEDNLRRAPKNERLHLNLGNIYLRQGRLAEAQQRYERVLEINPGYADVYASLSKVFAAQNRYDKAVALLEDGLRRNPLDYRLYNNLAFCYNALGDHGAAAEVLRQAIRLQPENAELHLNLGVAYQRQGILDQAIVEFRRAIDLKFDVPMNYYFNLGMALVSNGQFREALPAFLACYRVNPGHSGVLYNIAVVYHELGDAAAARGFAAQLHKIDARMASRLAARGL